MNTRPCYNLGESESKSSTIEMIKFLFEKYDFLNNIILNEVMISLKNQNTYLPVNPNTLYIEVRQAGKRTTVSEINTFLSSDYIVKVNPFEEYFRSLEKRFKEFKEDYIQKFSQYIEVENQERFSIQFKKWLVRCVVCALIQDYFNKQALTFVQEEQNSGKSTLTRFLIPDELYNYQAENIAVDKDSLIALCQNFIIIQDELSTLSKTEINAQKTLMSKSYIKVRHPYDRKPKMEPRRASIIGSTNRTEFLTDESGSVRWLCFNIKKINWNYKTEVDINAVWAQAYYLYRTGFKYEMTPAEIKENEISNNEHTTFTVEMELIQKYYSPGTNDDFQQFYTATELTEILTTNIEGKLKINPVEVGKALKILGFEQVQRRGHENQKYPVKGYLIKYNSLTTYCK
jgi:predicted P-loop ATPase